ncbi:MAG TPA: hypothetical protein VK400_09935 [Pyrinomonadaceae bacterium]|nr:hypothetical protein [Pyrinomonadaceae bacterium]
MKIEEIPLPPEARADTIEGRYEIELDGATNSILSELKKNYGKTQEKILFLPGETEASEIFEFYEPKLSKKGFSADRSVPAGSRNYQQRVWRSDGWFGGGQGVSVAVIDAGKDAAGNAIKFLAVYLAEK